jgi:hypothetical protein
VGSREALIQGERKRPTVNIEVRKRSAAAGGKLSRRTQRPMTSPTRRSHQTSNVRLVSDQRYFIRHVVSADFGVMDTDLAIGGQAGGFDRFSIGVGVGDVLAQLELDWFGRSQRFQDERTAGCVLFNSTGHFGSGFRVGAAAGGLRMEGGDHAKGTKEG